MRLKKSRDSVESVLHSLDGVPHVHRLVSAGVPKAFGNHERPQVGAVQFGLEFTACEGIPGQVDVRDPSFKLNSAPSVRIRRPVRNVESLIQEERETLVNSGVELRNSTLRHHDLSLSAFTDLSQPALARSNIYGRPMESPAQRKNALERVFPIIVSILMHISQ
jgi:hypothetical protein